MRTAKAYATVLPAGFCAMSTTWAHAQVAPPCGVDESVAPWISADVGMYAGGATRAVNSGSIALCSAAVGLGARADQYRLGTQAMPGDFHLQALLTELDLGGAAGLIAVGPNADWQAARIVIEARAVTAETVTVRASVRRGQGGVAEPWTDPIATTLPALLRIRRIDGMLRTELEDSAGLHIVLSADVSNSALADLVHVGVYQASLDAAVHRRATFSRFDVSTPYQPPSLDCIEPRALIPGETLTLRGAHLNGLRGVSLAGSEAEIIRVRDSQVTVRVGAATGSDFSAGDVILRGPSGTRMLPGGVAFTGAPFVRGDADGDGQVTRADWNQVCYQVHRNRPLACGASGDVDADGDVDAADLSYLRRFIESDGPAPIGPYPDAGYVRGALSCGLPAAPSIDAVSDAFGEAIDGAVREGDVLEIEGSALPDVANATVYFGDVPTQVLSDSSAERLRVRVGAVPSDAVRCPVVWRGRSHQGHTRFGQAFTVEHDTHVCPRFIASRMPLSFVSHVQGGAVVLSLPRDRFPAGQEVIVDAAFHLPFVDGVSRGPRGVRKQVLLPVDYAEALQHLADTLTLSLQGPSDDACACELTIAPNVAQGTLTIAPCDELPPEPPTPHVPGNPTQVQSTRIIVGHLDITGALPPVSTFNCNNQVSYANDRLGWSWCEVAQVALPPSDHEIDAFEAYPTFESMTPIQISLDANAVPWQLDPELKPASQKHVLVDDAIHTGMDQYGYDNGCDIVLRSKRCAVFTGGWMPRFREGGRVVKLFWLAQSKVPNGLDVSGLYSWVPANDNNPNTIEERQYLVGMHLNVATNDDFGINGYFRWITAWLPLPPGVQSPHYNPNCGAGDQSKRPVALQDTHFADWVLCNPAVVGQEACGNPWAPIDECSTPPQQGCVTCHRAMGRLSSPSMELAWLTAIPSYKGSDINACKNTLDNNPNHLPNWGGQPLMSLPASWAGTCTNDLYFPDPWKCHLSSPQCSATPGYPTP